MRDNPEGSESRHALRNDRGFVDLAQYFEYMPADFYFVIDSVTGERIDARNSTAETRGRAGAELAAIRQAALDQSKDLQRALVVDLSNAEKSELVLVASYYGQRHFANTSVANVEFVRALSDWDWDDNGNIVVIPGRAHFEVTDETGRIAGMAICMMTLQVTSISTMRNDMIPFGEVYAGRLDIDQRWAE